MNSDGGLADDLKRGVTGVVSDHSHDSTSINHWDDTLGEMNLWSKTQQMARTTQEHERNGNHEAGTMLRDS